MFCIDQYMQQLISLLKGHFGTRLTYVGLQGSYLRGEATPDSDIDVMVVIDSLSVSDLAAYRTIIESMECFDRSCGFICSKEDLLNWNRLEMCNLLNSTKDYYGALQDLIPEYTKEDVRNFIKFSVNNLYHALCHSFIHGSTEHNIAALPGHYKGVFFILQNLHYLNHGVFAGKKAELLTMLDGKNREVLEHSMVIGNGAQYEYDKSFELLFTWCQETLMAL